MIGPGVGSFFLVQFKQEWPRRASSQVCFSQPSSSNPPTGGIARNRPSGPGYRGGTSAVGRDTGSSSLYAFSTSTTESDAVTRTSWPTVAIHDDCMAAVRPRVALRGNFAPPLLDTADAGYWVLCLLWRPKISKRATSSNCFF